MRTTATVIQDILNERVRQELKWGIQKHEAPMWLTILVEEVGEVAKAIFEENPQGYREELIQVAAVAEAAVESYDAGAW